MYSLCATCRARLHILYAVRLQNELAYQTVHFKTDEFYKLCTDRFRYSADLRVQENQDITKLLAGGGEIWTLTQLGCTSNQVKLFAPCPPASSGSGSSSRRQWCGATLVLWNSRVIGGVCYRPDSQHQLQRAHPELGLLSLGATQRAGCENQMESQREISLNVKTDFLGPQRWTGPRVAVQQQGSVSALGSDVSVAAHELNISAVMWSSQDRMGLHLCSLRPDWRTGCGLQI